VTDRLAQVLRIRLPRRRKRCAIAGRRAGAASAEPHDMPCRFVTCPETAELENIGYDDSPLGMLIVSCTRYASPCALGCSRGCARHIDLRARLWGLRAGGVDNGLESEAG